MVWYGLNFWIFGYHAITVYNAKGYNKAIKCERFNEFDISEIDENQLKTPAEIDRNRCQQ